MGAKIAKEVKVLNGGQRHCAQWTVLKFEHRGSLQKNCLELLLTIAAADAAAAAMCGGLAKLNFATKQSSSLCSSPNEEDKSKVASLDKRVVLVVVARLTRT